MLSIESSYVESFSPLRAIIAHIVCFSSVVMLTASPLYAVDQGRTDSIRNSILALDSARETALGELERVSSSAREEADYKAFIVYLNTRIVSYCMELGKQGGATALEGLPCPTGRIQSGDEKTFKPAGEESFYTTGLGTAKAKTQAEQTKELDGEFISSLGEFDEMLLEEEGKVAARVPSQRESGASGQSGAAGSGGTSGAGAGTDAGEAGDTGSWASGTESDSTADGSAEGREGRSGAQGSAGAGDSDVDHSVYGAPGGKLPPPEDDDIVARQLREAAEKETDPELKKKLWEEYWKYKGVRKQDE
jgi:hypothetical protein